MSQAQTAEFKATEPDNDKMQRSVAREDRHEVVDSASLSLEKEKARIGEETDHYHHTLVH